MRRHGAIFRSQCPGPWRNSRRRWDTPPGEALTSTSTLPMCNGTDAVWPDDRREDAIRMALAQRLAEWLRCATSLSPETNALSDAARRMAAMCQSWMPSSGTTRDGDPIVLELSASLDR